MAEQWTAEARLRGLDDPVPIPVCWKATGRADLMDHPANRTPGVLAEAFSDDITALVEQFRLMGRRRLVILGGPGAGKTTLAVQIVRHLLATRESNQGEPIPVLMSAAGWGTERLPHLHDWVADRLAADYPALRAPDLGPDLPAVLARRGHILPVLDSLDELPAPVQASVITALNRSLAEQCPDTSIPGSAS